MIFKIQTADSKILSVEKMDWSNDNGYVYSLQEAVKVMGWNFHENVSLPAWMLGDPVSFGKFEIRRISMYMVETHQWSLACRIVEQLLEAKL